MNGFEVSRSDHSEVSVVLLRGYLDAHTYPTFEGALQKLVDEGRFRIVVNFSELSYISSAGLGVFMGFIEQVREQKGDIKLCAMSPKVFKVFDLLGFPTIYEIYETEETAVKKFGA